MTSRWVVRARIGAAHGVRGEVRVQPDTDYPERLEQTRTWLLRRGDGPVTEYRPVSLRRHQARLLVRFDGIADRDQAAALTGCDVVVDRADLPPLPEGEYYNVDLIGLAVVTVDGQHLGQINEIIRTGSNDVYVTPQVMIPAIRQVVREVDLDRGQMVIEPLPGMLED